MQSKVLELIQHILRRAKGLPTLGLPVEALLELTCKVDCPAMTINFAMIFVLRHFVRLLALSMSFLRHRESQCIATAAQSTA